MFVEEYLKELREHRYSPPAIAAYVYKCARQSWNAAQERPAAIRGVVLAGLVHLVLLFGASVAISLILDRELGRDYFVASSLWLAAGLIWVALHLGMFRHDRELPLSGLGLPNFLTLGRLLTVPAFYLFITRGHELLALIAFGVGGLSDVADGIAARKLGAVTRLGKIFDPLVDVLFNAVAALGLTVAGYLPVWLLVLIFLRYGVLLLGACWIYVVHGPVRVQPTVLGKATGVITSGLVFGVVLVHQFLEPGAAEKVLELLYIALGFVFALTTVQVVILGVSNIRRIAHGDAGRGPFTMVEPPRGERGR